MNSTETSPIWVYKDAESTFGTGKPRFVSFNARDILYIEQIFVTTNPDSVENQEVCCVVLKGSENGHLHLLIDFHEIMLRWMAFTERNGL